MTTTFKTTAAPKLPTRQRPSWQRRLGAVALVASGLCAVCTPATASVVYNYTGQFFTSFDTNTSNVGNLPFTYSTSDRITGQFTTALGAVGANVVNLQVATSAFSFFDGHVNYTDSAYHFNQLTVSTDATGDITQWTMIIAPNAGVPNAVFSNLLSQNNSQNTIDIANSYLCGNDCTTNHGSSFGRVFSAGDWVGPPLVAIDPPPTNGVPEPTSLALMGAALAGLVRVRRKSGIAPELVKV